MPTPPKKPAPQAPKFDAQRITALLDKRNPQRLAAAGEVINPTPALGASTGSAPTLSASEIDLFRAKLRECWDVPVALRDIDKISVPITIKFKIDGTLASPPEPENSDAGSADSGPDRKCGAGDHPVCALHDVLAFEI